VRFFRSSPRAPSSDDRFPIARLAAATAFGAFAVLALGGCPAQPERVELQTSLEVGAPGLDEVLEKTAVSGQAVMVLFIRPGQSPEDDAARTNFETPHARDDRAFRMLVDLTTPSASAQAARWHVVETPTLLCLSPQGLVVSRDSKPITIDLAAQRLEELPSLAQQLDAQLQALEQPIVTNPDDSSTRMALADFFLAHGNFREAITPLEFVAHTASNDAALRTRAWLALCRAHLSVAEPEPARLEAQEFLRVLGPHVPEARAAANLALGAQDADAQNIPAARAELAAAITAAPDSDYAQQARAALTKLSPSQPTP
jgi:tetratricopeptide (TPR) repeat protein